MFCEKPVGGTPAETARAERAARRAGVISGVGYNYRWAPPCATRRNSSQGRVGRREPLPRPLLLDVRGDPLGLLSWRFLVDEGGHGVTTDLMSHPVDLAHMLVGPIARVVGTAETFIRERPLPIPAGTHYGRGRPGDPVGAVTNEDYAGMLCVFENGARGTFEAGRTLLGPRARWRSTCTATPARSDGTWSG